MKKRERKEQVTFLLTPLGESNGEKLRVTPDHSKSQEAELRANAKMPACLPGLPRAAGAGTGKRTPACLANGKEEAWIPIGIQCTFNKKSR